MTVATNKASYRANESVTMTATVRAGNVAVANASVSFTLVKPGGATVALTATTNASGTASAVYRLARKDPPGAWQVRDAASHGGASAGASAGFTVQ